MPSRFGVVCAFVITMVGLTVYLPALKIGFYDGWWYLQWAASMDVPRYLVQFLDPANITQGYRPVQGLYIYLLYHLVGVNPDGYHLVHTALHAANAVLLFFIAHRLGKNLRLALVAALLYVTSPVISLAVFWHAVVDPLSAFFYLLTVQLWIRYLNRQRVFDWMLAFGAFILALFSKEVGIFLPIILFLVDWWFFGNKPSLRLHLKRYLAFVALLPPYLWLVLQVQSHGEFAGQFGFRLGPHMLANLMPYLAVLAFPWTTDRPLEASYYIWLAVVTLVYFGVAIYRRSLLLLLLAIVAVLNISPLTGFPLDYFNTRYLYLSVISSAVVLALVFETGWRFLRRKGMLSFAMTLIVAVFVVASGMRVAEASDGLAEFTRQVRVPFRDISRQHPTFPPDTFLYFVYSPMTSVYDFEGLFFVRYGDAVKVDSTETGNPARLRDHASAFVYYFDPTGRPIELPVDKAIAAKATPGLPVTFDGSIVLERYQMPSAAIQLSKALVLVLDWRAGSSPSEDYKVFVHLVDSSGTVISSWDGYSRRGESPTSTWQPHRLIVDAVVLPMGADAPVGGDYRLEVGMYDPTTMKRISITGPAGEPAGDKLIIAPISVVPPVE